MHQVADSVQVLLAIEIRAFCKTGAGGAALPRCCFTSTTQPAMAKRMKIELKANQPTLSGGVNGALSLGIVIPMPPPTVKVSAHTRHASGLSPQGLALEHVQ